MQSFYISFWKKGLYKTDFGGKQLFPPDFVFSLTKGQDIVWMYNMRNRGPLKEVSYTSESLNIIEHGIDESHSFLISSNTAHSCLNPSVWLWISATYLDWFCGNENSAENAVIFFVRNLEFDHYSGMRTFLFVLSDGLGSYVHPNQFDLHPYNLPVHQDQFSDLYSDRSIARSQQSGGLGPGGFPCQECSKVFSSHGARWHHIAAIHKKVTYTCVCGKVYTYRQNLLHHRKCCTLYLES